MKKISIIFSVIVLSALLGLYILVYLREDKTGPVIQIADRELSYQEGDDKRPLLQGVAAYDAKDGDVSDTLMIESILPLRDNMTAKVIYAAKDKDNHITKESIIINYTSDQKDVQEEEPIATKPATPTPTMPPVEKEEDLKEEQTVVGPKEDKPTAEEKEVTLDQNVLQTSETDQGKPVISLTEKKIFLQIGASFQPLRYVSDITDDKDSQDTLYRRISVVGVYNSNKAGTYILEYYVVDTDGNQSESAYLKMNITE
jgi:hypothetical protein